MFFSKSFGYAVRSVLYIAAAQSEQKAYIQLEEITSTLELPKQFMGRVLKNLVRAKILSSLKGPTGGFRIAGEGMQIKLVRILEITDGNKIDQCILKSDHCNPLNPCPVHFHFIKTREAAIEFLATITIAELVKGDHKTFAKSLCEKNGNGKRKQG